MKIIFNLINCGLGNNGGSATIVKSANVLKDLGHNVIIVDNVPIAYKWSEIKVEHKIVKNEKEIPDADVIIATGYATVESTLKADKGCGKKFHYIRGWETWKFSEDYIIKNILNVPTVKIVNSLCLKNKLNKYGIDSFIIRPGHDFEDFYPKGNREKSDYNNIIIGGLYNEGKKRSGKRTKWIFDVCNLLLDKEHDIKFSLWMFGTEKTIPPFPRFIKRAYFDNPPIDIKNSLYNSIDIWIAPTELEGLHIPPAEAMLTECAVVGTNTEMSGMEDYLINGGTGIVTNNDINSFYNGVKELVRNKELRLQLGKNGRRKILSLGDRKENMKRMVEILER